MLQNPHIKAQKYCFIQDLCLLADAHTLFWLFECLLEHVISTYK